MRPPLVFLLLCVLLGAQRLPDATAQAPKPKRQLGLGGQVGTPTGLTLKHYFNTTTGGVFLVSWNLDRFLLLSTHVTVERSIPDSPLRFFFGPGLFAFRGNAAQDRRFRFGVSALPGLNFFSGHFEVFLQANPGLRIIPNVKFSVGGTVGLRYYL